MALAATETAAQSPGNQSICAAAVARTGVMNGVPKMQALPRGQSSGRLPAATLQVASCADKEAAGSRRYEMFHAIDGDTINISNLVCSTIARAHCAIAIAQENLRVTSAPSSPITIAAHTASSAVATKTSPRYAVFEKYRTYECLCAIE